MRFGRLMSRLKKEERVKGGVKKIAELISYSEIVKSSFGDNGLFFKHTSWEDELEKIDNTKKQVWEYLVDDEFMKGKGCEDYMEFME